MGTSTNAIFGFGWVGDEEFSINPPENEEEGEDDTDIFDAAQQACEELGVSLGTHCHSDCRMAYLACDDTKVTKRHFVARRGGPIEISIEDMERLVFKMPTVMRKKLIAAVDMLHKEYPSVAEGIKLPSAVEIEFTWFLCSYWN